MNDHVAALSLEPERLEALSVSAGVEGSGATMEGAHQIARRTGASGHDLLVALGSGATDVLASWGKPAASLCLSDLPGVMVSVASGYKDRLGSYAVARGRKAGTQEDGGEWRVLVARGRTHLYEEYGPGPVVAPSRIAAAAGVRGAVLVNVGGCLRGWHTGEVTTIADHLSPTGSSPFDGPVFTDVCSVWDDELVDVLRGVTGRSGVYAAVRGPERQTMAETRTLEFAGADCVSMSTVLEVIALHQLGVRVAGMSVASDLSFAQAPTDPDEVARLVAGAHTVIAAGVEAVPAVIS